MLGAMIERGRATTLSDYTAALERQEHLRRTHDEWAAGYDAIVTLSTAGTAPAWGEGDPDDSALIWTLCGAPALSAPVLRAADGMPLGVQLVGRRWNDHACSTSSSGWPPKACWATPPWPSPPLWRSRPDGSLVTASGTMPAVSLLVACHDAGGAEIVSSWLRRRPDADAVPCLLEGPARAIFARKLGPALRTVDALPSLDGLGLVLCGSSADAPLERGVVRAARAAGVRSAVWLDHWVNYPQRFVLDGAAVLPDEVWVADEHAERLAAETLPGAGSGCAATRISRTPPPRSIRWSRRAGVAASGSST